MNLLLKISLIKTLFYLLLIFKISLFIFINYNDFFLFSLGGDSDYYDDYARGLDVPSSSIWPVILRFMNDFGLYNRQFLALFIFTLTSTITPFLFASLLPKSTDKITERSRNLVFWSIAIIIAIYPTIFFYSLDIYRDGLMIFLFGICLHTIKGTINKTIKKAIPEFALFLILTYLLYLLRPYLGFSIIVAFFLYQIEYKKKRILYLSICYFFFLAFFQSLGLLDDLFIYRDSDVFLYGGSSLGINLMQKSSLEFIALFLYSGLMQFFGLYIISTKALMVFISESLPILFLSYI